MGLEAGIYFCSLLKIIGFQNLLTMVCNSSNFQRLGEGEPLDVVYCRLTIWFYGVCVWSRFLHCSDYATFLITPIL